MKDERSLMQRLLHGTGVIMTVYGALEMVLFIVYLGVVLFASHTVGSVLSAKTEIIGAAAFLAAALTELIAGILGFRSVKTGGSTTPCLIFGILCLLLTVASLILLGARMKLLTVASIAVCAVLPVILIASAVAVRRSGKAPEAEEAVKE